MGILGKSVKSFSFLTMALALACSPDPPSLVSLEDNAVVAQSDGETDEVEKVDEVPADTVQDTGVGTETELAPSNVHFLLDTMALSGANDGCDLDDNGTLDNSFGKMLEKFAPMMPGDVDPSAGLEEAIEGGVILMALSILGVEDFESDDDLTIEFLRAELEDPEAGPADDLFSKYGSVMLVEPAQSVIDGATIENGRLITPKNEVVLEIPMGEQVMEMTVELAQISAKVDEVPDQDMLGGTLTEGKICGAIDKDEIKDKISAMVGNNKLIASFIGNFLNQNADVRCNGKPKQCLSMAMDFSAVTVSPL